MFTRTIVHSQNDGKQQEWEKMAESELISAASTQTARLVIYVCGLDVDCGSQMCLQSEFISS